MGRIQSSVGLISGFPIQETVDKLLAISARPRDLLASRTAALKQEQVAITELTALVIGVQLSAKRLQGVTQYSETKVSSSDASRLQVTKSGAPVQGTYQFTPVRPATTHSLLSAGVARTDEALGEGRLALRFGGFVDRGVELDQLNGGEGIERGKIRITDRSGSSAVVDLRFARTVDDVLSAINNSDQISVRAVTDGDAIRLIDTTGQTSSNLRVQEVGTGSTAADLGLGGIDVSSDEGLGQDVLRLHDQLRLNRLNDGNGIALRAGVSDLEISFRDNTTLQIDFDDERTVGELLETLNAADPTRLKADLSADGDRLKLTDLTTDDGGTFVVANSLGGTVAEELGLTGTASGGILTSRRLQAGLKTSLLSSLDGGAGLGSLGRLDLTNRAGDPTVSVDLSSAETLEEVARLINAADSGITAQVNRARNGLVLTDTSGGTGALVVANNGDGKGTADKLQLAVNAEVASIDSGSLDLQVISKQTRLDGLNQGKGVARGSVVITDSDGVSRTVNLSSDSVETVGDVLDKINALSFGVEARLNEAGDGILLVDTVGGAGTLTVAESGNGTTAADLKIVGEAVDLTVDGSTVRGIDGSTTVKIDVGAADTLEDLVEAINASEAGVKASIFSEGSGANPNRLSLVSKFSGSAGELLVDARSLGLDFQQLVAADDALLLVGDANSPGAGVLAASSNSRFENVLGGATLTVAGSSTEPVTITVQDSNETVLSNVKLFVDQYNKLVDKIDKVSFFNEADNTTGLLFGSTAVLRLESSLGSLLTGRVTGAGSIHALNQLGISLDGDTGKLALDDAKLGDLLAADPQAVEQFFATETQGFSARVDALVEKLAGEDNSLLINRNIALQRKIDVNNERIAFMEKRLTRERTTLETQFFELEGIISRMQSDLAAVANIRSLPTLTVSRPS